jgi:hypothetical protein
MQIRRNRWALSALLGGLAMLVLAPLAVADGMDAMDAAPGPAKKIKVIEFVVMDQLSVTKVQFLDAKGKETKAPEGTEFTFSTNITDPRTGKFALKDTRWDEEDKAYAYGKLPAKGKTCPGRTMTITITAKVGKTAMRATLSKSITCTRQ